MISWDFYIYLRLLDGFLTKEEVSDLQLLVNDSSSLDYWVNVVDRLNVCKSTLGDF